LTPQEAQEYGLIDLVITSRNGVKVPVAAAKTNGSTDASD
jgi:hypothetical protein